MNGRRILIVEDDESCRLLVQKQLEKQGYSTDTVGDAEQAIDILRKSLHHLVITDLQLPGISGIALLKQIQISFSGIPVIVVTAFGTVQGAVNAMKAGAYDFITKPIDAHELSALVRCALNQHRSAGSAHNASGPTLEDYGFEQVIGSSTSLRRALESAMRVASTGATVLILGETGTGKELVARAIHQYSLRRDKAFVTVSCGAIPKELLESELFGHTKGAFTGAIAHKKGKVEIAEEGTLFLDEIGEMPLSLQVRILRLLQERQIEKIGATTPVTVDIRILAATHRNLDAMVEDGSFREDLYYRLMVVPIHLPPLRERAGDIPQLVQHFLNRYKVKYNRTELTLPPEILDRFSRYQWPGNVRQLENTIERIVLLNEGPQVTLGELPEFLKKATEDVFQVLLPNDGLNVDAVEKQLILQALEKFGGNQTRAAHFLNMSRRAFSYRLKKCRL